MALNNLVHRDELFPRAAFAGAFTATARFVRCPEYGSASSRRLGAGPVGMRQAGHKK
jgi:hypothetical protein